MTRDLPNVFSLLMLILLPIGAVFEAMLELPATPDLLTILLYASLSTLLAALDNRELRHGGSTASVFWAWTLLLPLFYFWVRTKRISGNFAHLALWCAGAFTSVVIGAAYQKG